MYLLLTLICVIWLILSPSNSDILNTPFAQLTLNDLGNYFSSTLWDVVLIIGGFWSVSRSIEKDQIWPWRWTLKYFIMIMCKGIGVFFTLGIAYWFTSNIHEKSVSSLIMCWLVCLIAICYSLFIMTYSESNFYIWLNALKKKHRWLGFIFWIIRKFSPPID
jgi:hypothetical protein